MATPKKTQQQKMMVKYHAAIAALDNVVGLSTNEKDVYEFAELVLMAVSGKCLESLDGIQHTHGQQPDMDWATRIDKAVILKVLERIHGDGHTLFKPEGFIEDGLPESTVKFFTRVHATDLSSPQGFLMGNDGGMISHLEGIYGLELLRGIARSLGAKSSTAIGRGFAARELTDNIKEVYGGKQEG